MPGVRITGGHLPRSSPGDRATAGTSAEMAPPCLSCSPIPSHVSWERLRGESRVHDASLTAPAQPPLWAGASHVLLRPLSFSLGNMGGRNQMNRKGPVTDRERQAGSGGAASREWGCFLPLQLVRVRALGNDL